MPHASAARYRRLIATGVIVLLLAALPACTSPLTPPDLGEIYNRAAQYHGVDRNPVIVLPGIQGSRLVDRESGRVVWGAFGGDSINPETPGGARAVALPMKQGAPLASLKDRVEPDGALDRVQLDVFGIPLTLRAYAEVLGTLGAGGYRDMQLGEAGEVDYGDGHYTCFQFPYDWRRDNAESAAELHRFILKQKAYVAAEHRKRLGQDAKDLDPKDVKVDIVAHSMGGLVVRYYLRYGAQPLPEDGSLPKLTWEGAKHVERVILVGTPNGGSIKALDQLIYGSTLSSFLPSYEAALLGTMPSIYQLMPRSRHRPLRYRSPHSQDDTDKPVDLYDIELWKKHRWGLANPKQDRWLQALLPEVKDAATRRAIALDHLGKSLARAEQFHRAMDRPAKLPEGLSMHLIGGDAVMTPERGEIDAKGDMYMTVNAPGDGTVTRRNVLLDERTAENWKPRVESPLRFDSVFFLFSDHLGLTKDKTFSDNVLYLLLDAPR